MFKGISSQLKYLICVLFASSVYSAFIESERFESVAKVVVKESGVTAVPAVDMTTLLSGSVSPTRADLMLIREYLLSAVYIDSVIERLDIREHFKEHYVWSSIVGDSDKALRDFYLDVVSIEYDEYAGVLVISTQAFTSGKALEIVEDQLAAGSVFINSLNTTVAAREESFASSELSKHRLNLKEANARLASFKSQHGIIDMDSEAMSQLGLKAKIDEQISAVEAAKAAKSTYLKGESFEIKSLEAQLADLNRQRLLIMSSSVSGDDSSLVNLAYEYQDLTIDVEAATAAYASAMVAYERVIVDTYRELKHLLTIQAPVEFKRPVYPEVFKSVFTTVVFAALLMFIAMFIRASIRESVE